MQVLRTFARSSPAAAPDWLDVVYRFEHHAGIVHIGHAQRDCERDARGFDHKMALLARFASIRRIRAGFFAPRPPPSTEALDRSNWSASASCSKRTWCSRCQTLASCHSFKRRQQVVPNPQPSSGGSHDHGRLARRTKMMPRRQSRFEMQGRPPHGFSGSGGRSGLTTAQSWMLLVSICIIRLHARSTSLIELYSRGLSSARLNDTNSSIRPSL